MCKDAYDGLENCPCVTCRPVIHPYNYSVVELYGTVSDQLIVGFSGAIALNDVAIGHAMKHYFKVKKKDRLELSLAVRRLFNMINSETQLINKD